MWLSIKSWIGVFDWLKPQIALIGAVIAVVNKKITLDILFEEIFAMPQ